MEISSSAQSLQAVLERELLSDRNDVTVAYNKIHFLAKAVNF